MKVESAVMQDQIIEAALRRFSYFGIGKTTLTEVAEDLSVTKQTLSYYFPDKQSLIGAVMEKVAMDYCKELEEEMNRAGTVLAALLILTEVRSRFFRKYFMMLLEADLEVAGMKWAHERIRSLRENEKLLVTRLIEKGMKKGELKVGEAAKTATLLLETLHAFSRCIRDKHVIPAPEDFSEIFQKQQEVTKLFYEGLKSATWKQE